MDLPQFIKQLEAKQREIDDAMRRTLPVKVGRIAADHFHENFRKGGFVNGGLHPWQPTKRQLSGSKKATANYGPLLSGRKHLYGSIKYIPGEYRVTVRSDLVYAAIHNQGGAIVQQRGGKKKGKGKKSLALPKRVTIVIPQRQFLGESQELNQKINETIDKEISKIINNG